MTIVDRVKMMFGQRLPNGQKLATMQHDGRQYLLPMVETLLPGTKIDFARKVGDGLGSSVLAAPLNWIMRNFPQAPPLIERLEDEEWKPAPHALGELLRNPNPFYGGRELWMATALEFSFGNTYWLKIRNANDEVMQLWFVPSASMIPRWPNDGKTYISHYEYRPGGMARALGIDAGMTVMNRGGQGTGIPIPVRDVVHFRFGLDPRNPRLGLSPLGALMREVYTDDEAANFASVILQNLGIIGVVIAPKEKGTASKADVEATKEYLKKQFTGDKRGEPLALGQPTEVQLLQYNLQAFDMSPLRDVSEERVTAALGIPAAIVGFGTGLQSTKVGATMREMRRMAWTDCIIPMQEAIAEQGTRQLLTDETPRAQLRFDTSQVLALAEDDTEKHNRVRADYLAGIIKRSVAKRALGYAVDEATDEIYAQPTNMFLLKPGEPMPNQQNSRTDDATSNA